MNEKAKTPVLDSLIESGAVWLDKRTYYGRASDGVKVQLGALGYETELDGYLYFHRTPDKW